MDWIKKKKLFFYHPANHHPGGSSVLVSKGCFWDVVSKGSQGRSSERQPVVLWETRCAMVRARQGQSQVFSQEQRRRCCRAQAAACWSHSQQSVWGLSLSWHAEGTRVWQERQALVPLAGIQEWKWKTVLGSDLIHGQHSVTETGSG